VKKRKKGDPDRRKLPLDDPYLQINKRDSEGWENFSIDDMVDEFSAEEEQNAVVDAKVQMLLYKA
jgi:hypothetical protein